MSVSTAFNNSSSGWLTGWKGHGDVSVFVPCVTGVVEEVWQGVTSGCCCEPVPRLRVQLEKCHRLPARGEHYQCVLQQVVEKLSGDNSEGEEH